MVIASFVHDWFGWPDGAVLTNLVASLVWGGIGWRKLHRMHRDQRAMHSEQRSHHADVRALLGIDGTDDA